MFLNSLIKSRTWNIFEEKCNFGWLDPILMTWEKADKVVIRAGGSTPLPMSQKSESVSCPPLSRHVQFDNHSNLRLNICLQDRKIHEKCIELLDSNKVTSRTRHFGTSVHQCVTSLQGPLIFSPRNVSFFQIEFHQSTPLPFFVAPNPSLQQLH